MASFGRRSTLGAPLSKSTLNSRASMGVPRATKPHASKRMSLHPAAMRPGAGSEVNKRQSVGGKRASSIGGRSMDSRRSSVYGRAPTARKADPRPVENKAFQQKCIREVIEFLIDHGYELPLSPKILHSPTAKDVHSIFFFLYNQLDPQYQFEKFEEEVPAVLKTLLKYPMGISKSALSAVGSPHTWPTLLAALDWMIELLQYMETATQAREEHPELDPSWAPINFLNYLMDAYTAFLQGSNDFDVYKNALVEAHAERNESFVVATTHLAQQCTQMKHQLQEMETKQIPISVLQKKKMDQERDLAKFRHLSHELEKHKQIMERKLSEHQQELQARATELEVVTLEKGQLQATVAAQEISIEDVQRMTSQRRTLESALEDITQEKEGIIKEVSEKETLLSKKMQEVESVFQQFNKLAQQIGVASEEVVGPSLDGARSDQLASDAAIFQLHIDPSIEGLVTHHIGTTVRQAVSRKKEALIEAVFAAQESLVTSQERLDNADEKLSERQNEISTFEDQLKDIEAKCKSEKEATSQSLQLLMAARQGVEEEVTKLRAENSMSLSESQREIAVLQDEYNRLVHQTSQEKESCSQQALVLLDMVTQSKAFIQQHLLAVDEKAQEIRDEICASQS